MCIFACVSASITHLRVIGFFVCAGVCSWCVSVHLCSCLNYLPEQNLCLHMSVLMRVYECMHQRVREYLCA